MKNSNGKFSQNEYIKKLNDYLLENCWEGNINKIKLLILQGANIECQDSNKFTPLHIASYQGYFEIVNYLLSKGANIECQAIDKYTPLHFAARVDQRNIVEYLASYGAKIEFHEESTPLYIASQNGYLEIVKYLISQGANIECQARNNLTPLHIASHQGYLNINTTDDIQQTAYFYSIPKIQCRYLLQKYNANPFFAPNEKIRYLPNFFRKAEHVRHPNQIIFLNLKIRLSTDEQIDAEF